MTRAAFGQRRKMLRQSLKSMMPEPAAIIAAAGLDETVRAERCRSEGFVALANAWDAALAAGGGQRAAQICSVSNSLDEVCRIRSARLRFRRSAARIARRLKDFLEIVVDDHVVVFAPALDLHRAHWRGACAITSGESSARRSRRAFSSAMLGRQDEDRDDVVRAASRRTCRVPW